MNDGGTNPWFYFTGQDGIDAGWSRTDCQFFDGKKWKQCFVANTHSFGDFQASVKYRRPLNADTTRDKPLPDDLLPVEILCRYSDTGAVARLKGGKFAWIHDGTVDLVADLHDLPFCWIGWPGPAQSMSELAAKADDELVQWLNKTHAQKS